MEERKVVVGLSGAALTKHRKSGIYPSYWPPKTPLVIEPNEYTAIAFTQFRWPNRFFHNKRATIHLAPAEVPCLCWVNRRACRKRLAPTSSDKFAGNWLFLRLDHTKEICLALPVSCAYIYKVFCYKTRTIPLHQIMTSPNFDVE